MGCALERYSSCESLCISANSVLARAYADINKCNFWWPCPVASKGAHERKPNVFYCNPETKCKMEVPAKEQKVSTRWMAEIAKMLLSISKTCVKSRRRQHACVHLRRPMRKLSYILLMEIGIFVISAIHRVDIFCVLMGIAILRFVAGSH